MIFTHHTSQRWQINLNRTYLQTQRPKPHGLWLAVDDDWQQWCDANSWGHDRLGWSTEIKIDMSEIILIQGDEELDEFTATYGLDLYGTMHQIDWPLLAQKYKGIVIAPYLWNRRLHPRCSWYYGWDCASGCIWGLNAIVSIADSIQDGERLVQS